MQITTRRHGSWYTARADTPEERERALATVGAWAWFPYSDAVLVRADQLDRLAPPVVQPPPIAMSMTPNQGPSAGGTRSVVLMQTPAADTTAVLYDGVPGTDIVTNNPTQVLVTSPAGTDLVQVVVRTPRGDSNPVQFNYT